MKQESYIMHDGHHHHRPDHHTLGGNAKGVAQWQTPHLSDEVDQAISDEAKDLDLVEAAFFQGYALAEDPVSFLRLSGIAVEGVRDGKLLKLLRVEQAEKTDISTITPHLGGQSYSVDPLPARLVKKRKTSEFVYFDGESVVSLDFNQARSLEPVDKD